MIVDPFASYGLYAGIAASFAGFGTIAVSLGQRTGGDDTRIDANRLTNMLVASLTVTVAALLPQLIAALGFAPRWQTGLPAAAALGVMVVEGPPLVRRNLAIRQVAGYSWPTSTAMYVSLLIAFLAFLACAVGWPGYRPEAVYQLGLTGLLLSSIIMFARVAMSLLLPHNQD